jgi:hypothetical protein
MNPARNARDAHAQDFGANDSRNYKSRKHLYSPMLLHATRNAWCFQSVFSSRTACLSICSSPLRTLFIQHTPSPDTPTPSRSPPVLPTVQHCLYDCLLNKIFPNAHVSCTEEATLLQFLPSCCTKSGVHSNQTKQRWPPLLLKPAIISVIWVGVSLVVIGLNTTSINCHFTTELPDECIR